jgi:hypothetical protein
MMEPPSPGELAEAPPADAPVCRYFGCRQCYRLTYDSAQKHDARVDFLRRHPEQLAEILENLDGTPDGRLILAIKAMR